MTCVIALDVGGSSVKSALVATAERTRTALLTPLTVTPIDSRGSEATILNTLAQILRQHLLTVQQRHHICVGIGIGFPGPFDYAAGVSHIRGVAKFEALYGVAVAAALSGSLRGDFGGRALPLKFGNDAVCALLAEARYGAGQPHERLLGVVLGTGLGSAFVAAGRRVTEGRGVPRSGYLYAEPFAGATADEVFSTRGLQARLQRRTNAVSIPLAAQRARTGDAALAAVFTEFGRDLGTFLAPHASAFRAEALLLLGGITQASDLFAEGLQQTLPVPFYSSSLDNRAGVIGASLLLEGWRGSAREPCQGRVGWRLHSCLKLVETCYSPFSVSDYKLPQDSSPKVVARRYPFE